MNWNEEDRGKNCKHREEWLDFVKRRMSGKPLTEEDAQRMKLQRNKVPLHRCIYRENAKYFFVSISLEYVKNFDEYLTNAIVIIYV